MYGAEPLSKDHLNNTGREALYKDCLKCTGAEPLYKDHLGCTGETPLNVWAEPFDKTTLNVQGRIPL